MRIIQALIKEKGIRLSNSNGRWLVIDDLPPHRLFGEFVVYERKAYAKKTTEVYRGNDEDEAIKALLNEREQS